MNMIKFFRKIRQQLLTENKFSKYVIYAIGEIVLVVIGILIALQLNTWKENNTNRQVETTYLKGILNNLDQDINSLKLLLENGNEQVESYAMLLRAFTNSSNDIYSKTFLRAISKSQSSYIYLGHSIVFEDMKSSGKINFIKSDALRFEILEYYNFSSETEKKQSDNYILQISKLKDEAFTNNLDLNSLIERYIFKDSSAELDPLDLSFFNKDKSNIEVKNFANRISLLKTMVQANSINNDLLLNNAKKLKLKILEYSSDRIMTVVKDISQETIAAIEEGDLETLDKIISNLNINNCYDFDFDGDPLNYLAISIYYKSMPSLQFFVEKGADIENICENKTPLMFAVKYGQLEMVKYLVDQGAKLETISNEGRTVFDYAKKYGHPEIEKYLKDLLNK